MFRQLGIKYEGPLVPLQAVESFWTSPKKDIDALAQG